MKTARYCLGELKGRAAFRFLSAYSCCLMLFICLFFVQMPLSASNSSVTDTVPLQAHQTAPRTVTLQWQSSSQPVVIFRQYPDEDEPVEIATVADQTYTDHHHRAVCGDTVRYSIESIEDVGFAAVFVSDNEPTAPASWGVVTVDEPTQKIILEWTPSPDTDIMGYLVCEGTPSIAVDTVYGRLSNRYQCDFADPETAYLFRLVAFDSCRQASALTETCNNIVLLLNSEPCSRDVFLSWNAYRFMPSGVGGYQVWVSEDDGPYRQLMTIDADHCNTTIQVSESCQKIKAYVVAISSDASLLALSNRVSYQFSTSQRPGYLYLRKVSVSDDGTAVTVAGQTDPTFASEGYKVYRKVGNGAPSVVGRCSPDADGSLVWHDLSARPLDEPHTYWFSTLDACGLSEVNSQQGSTILPVVNAVGGDVTISWNNYQGWEGTTSYTLLTSSLNSDNWRIVGSGVDTYQVDHIEGIDGQRRYKVIASEGGNSLYRHYDTLQSPVVYFRAPTNIWMPNAFTPNESSNNILIPKASFINDKGYTFTIFNRSGIMLFSTSDPLQGWDGRYKGILQSQGAYVYKITYHQSDNTDQIMLGTVLLIL